MQLLQHKIKVAKKEYNSDAYTFIDNCCDDFSMMSFSERRHIVEARRNKGRIFKGQKYLYQFIVEGGDTYSFRAIPELHEICIKYNIYPEN